MRTPFLPFEGENLWRGPVLETRLPSDRDIERAYEWLRVRNLEGSGFESSFVFRLAGVSMMERPSRKAFPEKRRPELPIELMALAKSHLDCTSPLCLEFRSRPGQSPTWECLLRANVVRGTRLTSVESAAQLWCETAATVGRGTAAYLFEPALPEVDEVDQRAGRTLRLARRAVGVRIPARVGIGFQERSSQERRPPSIVSIPMKPAWGRMQEMLNVLAQAPRMISVRFLLSPVELDLASVDLLIQTLSWLKSPSAKGVKYGTQDGGHSAPDPITLAAVEQTLGCWIRRPVGFSVRCELRSCDGVPAEALVALARDFTGLEPADHHQSANGDLNLAEMAHEELGLPALLPSAAHLVRFGVRPILGGIQEPPEPGSVIGYLPGTEPILVRVPDHARDKHCYILGASGTGKSTLMYNMITQELARGHGLCLLDPHGELFEWVLNSIPASRADDVIIIDPYDPDWVVGLNVLECAGDNRAFEAQIATSEMLRIMDRLYDLQLTGGPMFETYMRNAMFLVMDDPSQGATLLEVVRVFEDDDYRKKLVKACSNPTVARFWSKQAERACGEASLTNMAPYITSKLNQFTQNALLRPIIGQRRSTVSFAEAMDKGRIVLVNLAVGLLGVRDAQLLGMLVMAKLLQAGLGRSASGKRPRNPMFVYLDEFQYFLTDTSVAALSQSRKFGICLTLAHQHVSQLEHQKLGSQLVDAVLGNVGTKLLFRVGPRDAERLHGWVRPYISTHQLQQIANHDLVANLPGVKRASIPMVVQTAPRSSCPYECVAAEELRSRQSGYALARQVAEDEIAGRSAHELDSRRAVTVN